MNSVKRKQRLKKLLDTGREICSTAEVEDNIETIEKISNIVRETDYLDNQTDPKHSAENTTEVVMDAQVIKMSHELVSQVMQNLGSTEFSDEEFINSIIHLAFKDNVEDWNPITKIAAKVAKTSRFSLSLLGTFDHDAVEEERVAKERRKRPNKDLAAEKRPENVSKLDKEEKDHQKVNLVLRRIKKLYEEYDNTPIPLYKLIIDPDNFMCTADNGFQVAFLAQDRSIAVERGRDGFPTIRPISKDERKQALDKPETVQAICNLNPTFCNKMVKKYKISEPLLIINREGHSENTPRPSCSRRN